MTKISTFPQNFHSYPIIRPSNYNNTNTSKNLNILQTCHNLRPTTTILPLTNNNLPYSNLENNAESNYQHVDKFYPPSVPARNYLTSHLGQDSQHATYRCKNLKPTKTSGRNCNKNINNIHNIQIYTAPSLNENYKNNSKNFKSVNAKINKCSHNLKNLHLANTNLPTVNFQHLAIKNNVNVTNVYVNNISKYTNVPVKRKSISNSFSKSFSKTGNISQNNSYYRKLSQTCSWQKLNLFSISSQKSCDKIITSNKIVQLKSHRKNKTGKIESKNFIFTGNYPGNYSGKPIPICQNISIRIDFCI